jgi:hypothetical protein
MKQPSESLEFTDPWALFPVLNPETGEDYCVLNNVWGVGNSADLLSKTQTVIGYDKDADSVYVNASFDPASFDPAKVRTYQQVYSGNKDSNLPICGLETLPCKVSDVSELTTDYSFTPLAVSDGIFNAALEVFLHSAPNPVISGTNTDTRDFEMMVWVRSPSQGVDLNTLGTMAMSTRDFALFVRPEDNYAAFILAEERSVGEIKWKEYLTIASAFFPNIDFENLWFTSVEMGAELYAGTAAFTIDKFTNTAKKVEDIVPVEDAANTDTVAVSLDFTHRLLELNHALVTNICACTAARSDTIRELYAYRDVLPKEALTQLLEAYEQDDPLNGSMAVIRSMVHNQIKERME